MGTYCTHYRKLALLVGYTPIDGLETEACRYLFQLWGLGYSKGFLKGAVSAMCALEETGWLPEFVTGRVWRCAKWATSQAVARPYAGLEEVRSFARACDGRAQWTAYGMAVLSFMCLLRVGEAASMRRGGSSGRDLGFHTFKCDPHFVRRRLGSYGRAWLRWLDPEGSTSAVPLAHFCPQGAAYLRIVMAAALSGCESAHLRWHAWRRGRSAALRWLGLPVRWLAWWGRWMSESAAAHYDDAPDDFIVADSVELPWPSAQGGMEWEWRVVSLQDIFPGELLALCVREKDVGREEDIGGWRDAEVIAESRTDHGRRDDGGDQGDGQPGGGGGAGTEGARESPDRTADWRVLDVPLAFAAVQGRPGSERTGARREREDAIDVDVEPPPPLSAGTSSIRRLRIAAHRTGAVASVLGKRKAAGTARLPGAAARAAVSRRVGSGSVGSEAPAMR